MSEMMITIIVSILGSSSLCTLITFFINRHDKKKEAKNNISGKLDKIIREQEKSEKDALRTQLLVMMNLMPESTEEIMRCAQRYFDELNGDWWYSSLFNKYLKKYDIDKPLWFDENK